MLSPILVGSALTLTAAHAEDSVALRVGRRTVTYGELDSLSGALAFALEQRGVGPGDRVATLLGGVEAVVAFWAVVKAGAVGVPLDEDDTEGLAETLRTVDARALIVDATIAPTFHHAVARAPALRAVIVRGRAADVDAAGSAAYVTYETALAEEDPRSDARPLPCVDLDDAWLERDHDGTRCALSHRVLLARGASLAAGIDLVPADVAFGGPPSELAIACALAGASMRCDGVEPPSEPEAEAPATTGRTLFVGAADDHLDEPGVTVMRIHRSTRAGPIALLAAGNQPARVLPNVDVRIVDDEGNVAPPKVVGEMSLRSSSLADVVAVMGGYFRTGDAGMLDDSGALYVL